jgi:hypothetical protein
MSFVNLGVICANAGNFGQVVVNTNSGDRIRRASGGSSYDYFINLDV